MRSLIEDEVRKREGVELPPDGMSLDLLRAVYRNSSIPLSTRIRCAIAALPFETPKLAVTAQVSEQDFATVLERRLNHLKQIEEMAVIETQPDRLDAQLPPRTADKPPLPRITERGFKRI